MKKRASYVCAPKTNYAKAWNDFLQTEIYKYLNKKIESFGFKHPYGQNIIRQIFDAGWNASGVEVKFLENNISDSDNIQQPERTYTEADMKEFAKFAWNRWEDYRHSLTESITVEELLNQFKSK